MPAWLTTSDWIFTTISVILALLAAWLLYRGLFRDRSKGKRRCPMCWYDLAGINATVAGPPPIFMCPECGRRFPERKLFRTRRYWRTAFAGAVLAAAAYGAFSTPRVLRSDWTALVPTTALCLFAPPDPDGTDVPAMVLARAARGQGTAQPAPWRKQLAAAMWRRIETARCFDWQAQLYIGRVAKAEKLDISSEFYRLPPVWLANETLPVSISDSPRLAQLLRHSVALFRPNYVLQVKSSQDTWEPLARLGSWNRGEPNPYRLPAPRVSQPYRFDARLVLERPGHSPIIIEERTVEPALRVVTNAEDVLTPLDTPEINRLVRIALTPRLVRYKQRIEFAVNNRLSDPNWKQIDFPGGLTFTIRCGDVVLGTGQVCSWSRLVARDLWNDSDIKWLTDIEPIINSGAPILADIQADPIAAIREYANAPFQYSGAAAWGGHFTCKLPLVNSAQPYLTTPADNELPGEDKR